MKIPNNLFRSNRPQPISTLKKPIKFFDGRTKRMRAYKKARSIFILIVLLTYVLHSVYVAYNAANNLDVSAHNNTSKIQQQNKSNDKGTETLSSQPLVATISIKITTEKRVTKQVQKSSPQPTLKGIYRFVKAYPGSRVDKKYVDTILEQCGGNVHTTARVIAIATTETGLGRDVPWKNTNFYGWYLNRNKAYDPSLQEMGRQMCRALGPNGAYRTIGINRKITSIYTGADRTDRWIKDFNWALGRMAIEKL